eukprot:TRINITY_DN6063_c0_g1_i1.p1 TRINITY_DN6063_c0_g1~~TRINITY_DN6063_c0_g1_i1.p1  ORF type:complete len:259 (+),score=32.38 TRINITY_DN6063_c0_g1_i1:235-1011(+)
MPLHQLDDGLLWAIVSYLGGDSLSDCARVSQLRDAVCARRLQEHFGYFSSLKRFESSCSLFAALVDDATGRVVRNRLRDELYCLPPTRNIVSLTVEVSIHDSFKYFQNLVVSELQSKRPLLGTEIELSETDTNRCCGVVQSLILESVELQSVLTCSFKLLCSDEPFYIVACYQNSPSDIEVFIEQSDGTTTDIEDSNLSPLPDLIQLPLSVLLTLMKVLVSFPNPAYPGCASLADTTEYSHLVANYINGVGVKKFNVM